MHILISYCIGKCVFSMACSMHAGDSKAHTLLWPLLGVYEHLIIP